MPSPSKTKKEVEKAPNVFRPKYDGRIHNKLIVEIFESGGTLAQFCTHPTVRTGRQTVYGWYARYPAFREAYDLGRELAKAHHEKVIESNLIVEKDAPTQFDINTYLKVNNVRFAGMLSEAPIEDIIDDKDLMQSVKNLANAAAKNVISQEQVRNIMLLLGQASQIIEQQEIVKRLDRLEGETDAIGHSETA